MEGAEQRDTLSLMHTEFFPLLNSYFMKKVAHQRCYIAGFMYSFIGYAIVLVGFFLFFL